MPSAHPKTVNDLKYANVKVYNAGAWTAPEEVWVHNGSAWVEPDQISTHNGSVWVKQTETIKYIQGSGSFFAESSNSNAFNNYVDAGDTRAIYEFTISLTVTGVRQTLFSYGNGDSSSFYEIYIGSDNKVYSSSKFDVSSVYTYNHETALSANTYYKIRVEHKSGSGTRTVIQIRDINNATVGVDVASTATTYTYSTTVDKFIGKRWTNNFYFQSVLLNVYIDGATTSSGTHTILDANSFSASSGTTIVDTATGDGTHNFTITGSTVSITG